jgi:hypothetical protein
VRAHRFRAPLLALPAALLLAHLSVLEEASADGQVRASQFNEAPNPLLSPPETDALDAGLSDADAEAAEGFDPYEGMDSDGRIPKAEMPLDLAHPERWRYIPEGRMPSGNLFRRFMVTSFVIPFVFHDGDVGTGAGVALTDIDFRAQRRRELAGAFLSYTSKGQQSYFGFWRRWLNTRDLPGGGVIQEERSFFGVSGGYQKTLTRRFFGFGANSDEDDEIKYIDELYELELKLATTVPDPGSSLLLTLGARAEFHNLSGKCKNILNGLERDVLCQRDDFDKQAALKKIIGDSDQEQLGWLIAGVKWDTRDSSRNPYAGFYAGVTTEAALLQDEQDVGAHWQIVAGKAIPVPPIFHDGGDDAEQNPPTDTLAFGFQNRFKTGDLPFTALPTLGGSRTLRGFIDGRFRDDASWHAGVEYRIWIIPRGFPITKSIRVERVGIAPFVEAGSVAGKEFDLFDSKVRYSYGIGLRALLERAAPFRLDFGFSDEGFNLSARFGYTF